MGEVADGQCPPVGASRLESPPALQSAEVGSHDLNPQSDEQLSRLTPASSRSRRRLVANITLAVIAVAPIFGFVVAERAYEGQPRATRPAGSAGLVFAEGSLSKAWLLADTGPIDGNYSDPTGPGDTGYTVLVCGNGRVDGGLLLVGDARLAHARQETSPLVWKPASLQVFSTSNSVDADLRGAQFFEFSIDARPCDDAYDPITANTAANGPAAAPVLRGDALRPVRRRYQLGPWHGPHKWWAWPAIGRVPGFADSGDRGGNSVVLPPSGNGGKGWGLPPVETYIVRGGTIKAQDSVDFERPTSSSDNEFQWKSTNAAVAPIVRLVDADSQQHWQTTFTAMTILLGLGLGIMATVVMNGLLGWANAKHLHHLSSPRHQPSESSSNPPAPATRH
jgi:hypothetical protein